MKFKFKIASILAIILGLLSIIAGSKALFEIDIKAYTIIKWLVIYNVVFGFISIITSYLIWSKHQLLKQAVLFILISHSSILLYLYFLNKSVASESIKAMLFRVGVWLIIFLLIINHKIKKP